MLSLTIKKGQRVFIGQSWIRLCEIHGKRATLAFDFPRRIRILREQFVGGVDALEQIESTDDTTLDDIRREVLSTIAVASAEIPIADVQLNLERSSRMRGERDAARRVLAIIDKESR